MLLYAYIFIMCQGERVRNIPTCRSSHAHMYSLDKIRSIERPCTVPDFGILCDILWSDPEPQITVGGSIGRVGGRWVSEWVGGSVGGLVNSLVFSLFLGSLVSSFAVSANVIGMHIGCRHCVV